MEAFGIENVKPGLNATGGVRLVSLLMQEIFKVLQQRLKLLKAFCTSLLSRCSHCTVCCTC